MEKFHRSVMVAEAMDLLRISAQGRYLDCTFGEGGHTQAMLAAGAAEVVGLDRDREALTIYAEAGELRADPRLTLKHGRFSDTHRLFTSAFDGILMDLGVSTRQLLLAKRGFSFSQTGPLDMRMDAAGESLTLGQHLSQISAEELAEQLERNADLTRTLPMARDLLDSYRNGKITNTNELSKIMGQRWGKRHPATVLFLALRMMVNEEWEEIEAGIPAAVDALKPGARLVVITFHSTEDRVVKRLFKLLSGKCACEWGATICACPKVKRVSLVTKKPLVPSREEMRTNPRARSAKMRCVEKLPLEQYNET